jgi:hypothetical protein
MAAAEITYNNAPSEFPAPNPIQDHNQDLDQHKNSPVLVIGLIAFILILILTWVYLIFGRGTVSQQIPPETVQQNLPAIPGESQ